MRQIYQRDRQADRHDGGGEEEGNMQLKQLDVVGKMEDQRMNPIFLT